MTGNVLTSVVLKANDAHHLMRSTAGDPQSWVEATSRMMGAAGAGGARGFKGGPPGSGQGSGGPMSPSMVSVTSNDSFSSSLPESEYCLHQYTTNTVDSTELTPHARLSRY